MDYDEPLVPMRETIRQNELAGIELLRSMSLPTEIVSGGTTSYSEVRASSSAEKHGKGDE